MIVQRFASRIACLVVGVAVAALLMAPAAGATGYDPIASGGTTLKLSPAFLGVLHRAGVKLEGKGGVIVHGRAISFPVTAGKLEPVEAVGTIEHGGRLVFRVGARKLPLRSLQLKTTRARAPFAAKFGGGQLKLSTGAKLTSGRTGFGSEFQVTGMRLSAKVAIRLDKKLDLQDVFRAGQLLGGAGTVVEPATVGLEGSGRAEFNLDPGFGAKLQSFFVAVNPIFPAEHPGSFSLPIGGGVLALDGSSGFVKTTGGLEFIQVGGGQFFIKDLEPEITGGQLNAEQQLVLATSGPGPNSVGPVLGLGGGSFSIEPGARTITDSGMPLTLSATVAQGFNEAFAKPLGRPDSFSAGEVVGSIGFTVQAE